MRSDAPGSRSRPFARASSRHHPAGGAVTRQRFGEDVAAILPRHERALRAAHERCRAELALTTEEARRGLRPEFVNHMLPMPGEPTAALRPTEQQWEESVADKSMGLPRAAGVVPRQSRPRDR
jgi:hypothetical protein